MTTITRFDAFYAETLLNIMAQEPQINIRTGYHTKAISGVFYRTTTQPPIPPLVSLRDINLKWSCLEMVWSIAGRSDVEFFHFLGLKGWDQFADENGFIESAYGYRWRKSFGRDQLVDLIKGLTLDNTSRHGILMTWDPRSDGLMQERKANVPCVILWHFHVIHGELHLTVVQRSADMIIGYPHDVFGAHVLQRIIASTLHMPVGSLSYLVSNAHIYEEHFEQAKVMIGRAHGKRIEDPTHLPEVDSIIYDNIVLGLSAIELQEIALNLYKEFNKAYNPMPKLKGMKVIA